MRKVSIIIPTFNEEDNVGNLVNQIDYALKGINYEVIFVDDSNDNTPEKIKEIIKENDRVLFFLFCGVEGRGRFGC